ncbi:MAG: glycosyltransferase family 4 protein [Candidatus Burarchaeum sp.]|nr:glycosyltransferase family 4 protein [Candidatus Burarchaeum sp.]MDO8339058.1 glycosyltransferase family 4 protein [Candidatus Burarchaeum sp.]
MRVLLVNTYPTRVHWGVEVVVENLMAGLRRKGHKADLLCLSDAELAVLQALRFPEKFLINSLLFSKLAPAAHKYDVLHFQAYNSYIAKFVKSKPRVVTLHGSSFGLHERVAHAMAPHRLAYSRHVIERMEREGTQNCDAVVAVSESVKNEAIRGYRIPHSKISIVHNAVVLDSKKKSKAALRQELHLPIDSPILITVTRGDYTKGTDMLVRICARLHAKYGAKLLVIGSIPANLRREWMIFAKPKHAEIWKYYQASDVYLNTSRYEGFGLAMLEAMGYGVPAVAFPVGIAPDAIKGGKNGYVVNRYDTLDYYDKVAKLITNEKLRARLGKEAAKTVKKEFSIEKMVNGYLKVYLKLSEKS